MKELTEIERAIVAMCKSFPKRFELALEDVTPKLTEQQKFQAVVLRDRITSSTNKVVLFKKHNEPNPKIHRELQRLKDSIAEFGLLLGFMEQQ